MVNSLQHPWCSSSEMLVQTFINNTLLNILADMLTPSGISVLFLSFPTGQIMTSCSSDFAHQHLKHITGRSCIKALGRRCMPNYHCSLSIAVELQACGSTSSALQCPSVSYAALFAISSKRRACCHLPLCLLTASGQLNLPCG